MAKTSESVSKFSWNYLVATPIDMDNVVTIISTRSILGSWILNCYVWGQANLGDNLDLKTAMVAGEKFGWRIRTLREQQETFDLLFNLGYNLDIDSYRYHLFHLTDYILQKEQYLMKLVKGMDKGDNLVRDVVDEAGLNYKILQDLDAALLRDTRLFNMGGFEEVTKSKMIWPSKVLKFFDWISEEDRWDRHQDTYGSKCCLHDAGADQMVLGTLMKIAGSLFRVIFACFSRNICDMNHATTYVNNKHDYSIQHYLHQAENLSKFKDLIKVDGAQDVIHSGDWVKWISSQGQVIPPNSDEVFGLCFFAGFFQNQCEQYIDAYMPDDLERYKTSLSLILAGKNPNFTSIVLHSRENLDALKLLYQKFENPLMMKEEPDTGTDARPGFMEPRTIQAVVVAPVAKPYAAKVTEVAKDSGIIWVPILVAGAVLLFFAGK